MTENEVIEKLEFFKKAIINLKNENSSLSEAASNSEIENGKTIENYELSKVIGNEKGIYTKEDSVVTYVYEYVMGQGDMKDPIEEKPYTGITETNNTLDYILASSSLLSAAILVILKKNLTNFFFYAYFFFKHLL